MVAIETFTFNPFQENTYVLYDESKECVIIDPGCYNHAEEKDLSAFIKDNDLKPVHLLNTHCHIDHVLGNKYVAETYQLKLSMHKADLPLLESLVQVGQMYGVPASPSPAPEIFLEEGDVVKFGKAKLDILFAPGHAPGHIVFIHHEQKFIIGGDVLFQGSIGRTDLPGGDYDTLIRSIKTKLLPLEDEYVVHSGHGPITNIGFERKNNPFLQ